MSDDAIFLNEIPTAPPREPASDPNYIKHVNCSGASFHVISYHTDGMKCSERDCIFNKPHPLIESVNNVKSAWGDFVQAFKS